MLDACHTETTDCFAGASVFQGRTQMTRVDRVHLASWSSGVYTTCEMDPILGFPWRGFKFGVLRITGCAL